MLVRDGHQNVFCTLEAASAWLNEVTLSMLLHAIPPVSYALKEM